MALKRFLGLANRFSAPTVIALGVVLLALSLQMQGLLEPLERRISDTYFQWQGARYQPAHTVIVAIDESTLSAYPDDPLVFWTPRLAQAIETLRAAGAKVVGLDLLLSISPERWLGRLDTASSTVRDYDRPLRTQINSGSVVLAASRSGPGGMTSDYLLPSPDYLLALPNFDLPAYIGLADLTDDADGVVRRYRIAPVEAGVRARLKDPLPALSLPALLAIHATGAAPAERQWQLGSHTLTLDDPARPIPFAGPPGSFPRIPLQSLLAADALSRPEVKALNGKVAIIGTTAPGLNDGHFTPYATPFLSGQQHLMSGAEIHANVVEALLGNHVLDAPSPATLAILTATAALVAAVAFIHLPIGVALLGGAALIPLLVLAGLLAFSHGWLLPVGAPATASILALIGTTGWRFTGAERSRAHLRQLFGRYVSTDVVEALLKHPHAPSLGGETQTITVLFSDIRNFTTISEKLAAHEVVEMLNAYFDRACSVLQAEGGSIDKFIGDAIMVEFGAPLPYPDHARRAVRAALALARVAEEFAEWMQARFGDRQLPPFAIGIGVHSGEAIVGNVGASTRMEYTAIGDTVNLASRLEGVTKPMGCVILASDSTLSAAGNGIRTGKTDVVSVKGREAPVRVFEIIDITS